MAMTKEISADRVYERIFVGERQIDVQHFYAVLWDHLGRPVKFAVGYRTPDSVYHTGLVSYDPVHGGFGETKTEVVFPLA